MDDENRTLSDSDVEAIVSRLKNELADDFYKAMGKGFWGLVRKALFYLFGGAVIAAAIKGIKP